MGADRATASIDQLSRLYYYVRTYEGDERRDHHCVLAKHQTTPEFASSDPCSFVYVVRYTFVHAEVILRIKRKYEKW